MQTIDGRVIITRYSDDVLTFFWEGGANVAITPELLRGPLPVADRRWLRQVGNEVVIGPYRAAITGEDHLYVYARRISNW